MDLVTLKNTVNNLSGSAQRPQSRNLLRLMCVASGFRFSFSSCFAIGSFNILFVFSFLLYSSANTLPFLRLLKIAGFKTP